MSDAINPEHYKRLPAEAIEIIESAIQNAPDNIAAYNHGQQLKYDLRLFEKGKTLREYLIDQEKHCWYSDRLREHLRKLVEQEDKYEQQKASDLQSLKDHPFGKLKTASLNSDNIPEGYRKLNDSSEEPRQLGDLRWSVSEKRYVEISVDDIGYANRDNWAACRKVEPVIKQSLKTEPPDGWRPNDNVALAMQMAANSFGSKDGVFNAANFSNAMRRIAGVTCNLDGYVVATILGGRSDVEVLQGGSHYRYLFYESISSSKEPAEPPKPTEEVTVEVTGEVTGEVKNPIGCPDGWRFLEVGEKFFLGDTTVNSDGTPYMKTSISKYCESCKCQLSKTFIRRNRFEVGEKVIDCRTGEVYSVQHVDGQRPIVFFYGVSNGVESKHLAPYIEDAK